jgi:hypothetical protein
MSMMARQKVLVRIMWTSTYQNMTFAKQLQREILWPWWKHIA